MAKTALMNHIHDLHFKKDILPLFDFVGNEFARETLTDLLSFLPGSLDEVLERQDILKSLLGYKDIFKPCPYSRSEFNEVYGYIRELKDRNTLEGEASLKIRYWMKRSLRDRERGRLTQLFILLHKIGQTWFAQLRPGDFPDPFADMLRNIDTTLSRLEIGKYQAIARERAYTIKETLHLLGLLNTCIRQGEMDKFWNDLFLVESWISIARGIHNQHFNFPAFDDQTFAIDDFYHPLLKAPVTNSCHISGNVTLITGPNMSGKSTLLRSIGLCVLLAHMGLAVPARQCTIPFFDLLSVAIDLDDDMRSGYSHFMKEIVTLKNVVAAANGSKKCFAIFDELFRGTNIEDALAISATTIRGLTRFPGSYFFISTHLHQLKDIVTGDPGKIAALYIECQVEAGKPIFTYRLMHGFSDLKIGQILFRMEGLDRLLS